LEQLLDAGTERRLTTVVADAGFGKSTLPAAWSAGRGQHLPCDRRRLGREVLVVPFGVFEHEGACAADVVCPGLFASAYRPFLRLAVGRHQPNSLPGLELSQIVRGPLVPLLPEREFTVDVRTPSQLTFSLRGPWPASNHRNRFDVVLECLVAVADGRGVTVSALSASPPNGMEAWVAIEGGSLPDRTQHSDAGETVRHRADSRSRPRGGGAPPA